MNDILTAAYDNWFYIFVTVCLMIIAFCQGSIISIKRHIKHLNEHSDWLKSWGLDWRGIALNLYVEDQNWSDDLKADLKRVAARVKEETDGQRDNL